MKRLPQIPTILVILLIGTIIITSCTVPINEAPDYYVMHHKFGGWVYMDRKIEIFENKDVYIKDAYHSIKGTISNEEFFEIYSKIIENNFLELDSIYGEGYCADGYYYIVTYASAGDSHTVQVSDCEIYRSDGAWEEKFLNIAQYIMDYSYTVGMDIDTGLVTIKREHPLIRWPYSNTVKLSDNIESHVNVDQDIIDYLNEIKEENLHSRFLENNIIYSVSCNDSSIHIIYPNEGTRWPFTTKLSEITDNGYLIYGNDFIWLNDTLDNMVHYPRFFYDSKIDSNTSVYEINLIQGNYFE